MKQTNLLKICSTLVLAVFAFSACTTNTKTNTLQTKVKPNISMIEAVNTGDEEAVNYYIKSGEDVNQRDGKPLILLAAEQGSLPVIKSLINAGADVNKTNTANGTTPLMIASLQGNTEIVKELIAAGADINIKDNHGYTAIYLATKYPEVLQELIAAGSDINAKNNEGFTALMRAIIYGNSNTIDIAETLIAAGADVNAKEKHGLTPLMFASLPGIYTISYACDHAEDPAECFRQMSQKYSKKEDSIEGTSIKDIERGVSPSYPMTYKGSEYIKILIDAGADVNAKSNNNATALLIASGRNNVDVVKTLINAGADVNAKNIDGLTPLMNASASDNDNEVLKALISAGANIDATDNDGKTALMMASFEGHSKVVKELLAAGADINLQDKYYKTALEYAGENYNTEIVKLLKKAGAKK